MYYYSRFDEQSFWGTIRQIWTFYKSVVHRDVTAFFSYLVPDNSSWWFKDKLKWVAFSKMEPIGKHNVEGKAWNGQVILNMVVSLKENSVKAFRKTIFTEFLLISSIKCKGAWMLLTAMFLSSYFIGMRLNNIYNNMMLITLLINYGGFVAIECEALLPDVSDLVDEEMGFAQGWNFPSHTLSAVRTNLLENV